MAQHLAVEFSAALLARQRLVVAATDDVVPNASVAAAAQQANIPVNVADDVQLSSFITPPLLDRPPMLIAISSLGVAPLLARRMLAGAEAMMPPGSALIAPFIDATRP